VPLNLDLTEWLFGCTLEGTVLEARARARAVNLDTCFTRVHYRSSLFAKPLNIRDATYMYQNKVNMSQISHR